MKKIGIIKDGLSDFMILKKFLSSIFQKEQNIEIKDKNFIDLKGLKIGENINEYIDKANKNEEKDINGECADKLKKNILSILYAAATKYEDFTNKDIIVLNGDVEHRLIENENFFEEWVRRLYSIIHFSIDKFYDRMSLKGYSYINLPIIIPLILFPSIEILVAACYLSYKDKNTIRELRAKPDLKMKVWDTEYISAAIDNGKIENVLNLCFDTDYENSLYNIYKEIPEVRSFIHTLTYP